MKERAMNGQKGGVLHVAIGHAIERICHYLDSSKPAAFSHHLHASNPTFLCALPLSKDVPSSTHRNVSRPCSLSLATAAADTMTIS